MAPSGHFANRSVTTVVSGAARRAAGRMLGSAGDGRGEGTRIMWDTVEHGRGSGTLSHDLPCPACGHPAHSFLACSETCACVPPPVPGSGASRAAYIEAPDPAWLTAS